MTEQLVSCPSSVNTEHDVASSSARARNGKCVLCNALCCMGCTNVHELALRFFRLIKNLRVALGPMVVPTPAKNNSCKYMKQVSHTASLDLSVDKRYHRKSTHHAIIDWDWYCRNQLDCLSSLHSPWLAVPGQRKTALQGK